MSKFTQTSEYGTVFKVWPSVGWVNVALLGENTCRSLNYDEAVELASAIAEAAEEIKPKPSKAERIRQQAQVQGNGGSAAAMARRLDNILAILAEDGPL